MSAPVTSAWSRRRAAVAAEAEAADIAKVEAVTSAQHQALAEKPEEEVLAELDLPNPDDMQSGDDFSAFMKSSVPNALRNRALRTLWRSDPVLANVDMLVDYGEDFTGKGDVIGAIKTAYQVGKGYLKDETPDDAKPVAVEPQIEEDDTDDETPEPTIEKVELPTPAETQTQSPRRRMRFEFEQGDMTAKTGMNS